jgi:HPr kinase/phosphorylase
VNRASEIVHASAVAHEGRAMLILGAPGAGKSSLALGVIALGATLVADDRALLTAAPDGLRVAPAPGLAGLIEARRIGLLRLPHLPSARVVCAVDLDRTETERLPPRRNILLLGWPIPLTFRPGRLDPAAMSALLRHGPPLDPEAPVPQAPAPDAPF